MHRRQGWTAIVLVVAITACAIRSQQRALQAPDATQTLDGRSPYLKAHLRDGGVLILTGWAVDSVRRLVTGQGERLDPARRPLSAGPQEISLDSVALFETNRLGTPGGIVALTVLTGASVGITLACLSNPKACFGSCPTFFVQDGGRWTLRAEGFSASVAPSLEATDVDALGVDAAGGAVVPLRLTNEALETHVIRHADILAVPRARDGEGAFVTSAGEFWRAGPPVSPARCTAADGDCTSLVSRLDGRESYSAADSSDLATREYLDLEFADPGEGPVGLVIASRQTLLSTYLLYQTLAYMGRSAGAMLAGLERGDSRVGRQVRALSDVFGQIEVQEPGPNASWRSVGHSGETGPLAIDARLVRLDRTGAGPVRLRIRLTKGHWRIDQLALVHLRARVEPVRLAPSVVKRGNVADPAALATLLDPSRHLVTMPGDALTLEYRMPRTHAHYELFLESRGYYLEWMREEWMAEENPMLAVRILADPAAAAKWLAPRFKAYEAGMDSIFWKSRYAAP